MDFLWPFRRQPEAAGVPGVGPGWGNGGDKWAVVQDLYRQTPPAEVRGDLSTIQCLVNLKKNTLALDPVTVPEVDPAQIPLPPSVASSAASSSSSLSAVPSGPNADATEPPHIAPRYRLSFTFDSSTSCMVKIHWVAKEVVLERRDGTRQLLYVPKPTLREGVAGGLGAHTMVKRYGPFPAGLHQRFVLPEEDALDTAELRNRLVPEIQLVVGEGTKEEEASVEVEDEENDDSMEEEGEAGASEVVLDIEEGGANGALEGDGEQGTSKRRKSLAAAGTVAETKTAAPAPSHNSVYFPLIIQIESIPSEDESNDLTDLDIAPVHAQSTYVTLIANRDHKSYRLGVVKQRLMVDGVIYTLQDIFGFTDPSGTGSEEPSAASGDVDAEDLQTMRECVVCMSSPKDTAVLPLFRRPDANRRRGVFTLPRTPAVNAATASDVLILFFMYNDMANAMIDCQCFGGIAAATAAAFTRADPSKCQNTCQGMNSVCSDFGVAGTVYLYAVMATVGGNSTAAPSPAVGSTGNATPRPLPAAPSTATSPSAPATSTLSTADTSANTNASSTIAGKSQPLFLGIAIGIAIFSLVALLAVFLICRRRSRTGRGGVKPGKPSAFESPLMNESRTGTAAASLDLPRQGGTLDSRTGTMLSVYSVDPGMEMPHGWKDGMKLQASSQLAGRSTVRSEMSEWDGGQVEPLDD
ncbi:hypothetical protein HK101_001526 [Irineochytrium annulatum]|nr:hypothetical protein HK101_001526 [Irineochytrium annulatum]